MLFTETLKISGMSLRPSVTTCYSYDQHNFSFNVILNNIYIIYIVMGKMTL